MALTETFQGWFTKDRLATQIDAADRLTRRLRQAGQPGLPPRQRLAYDRLVDALNRLPRPITVLGSLALVASGLIAPDWFAARMETLAQMPEGLWWIIGGVVSLHFGARYQAKAQDFEREIVEAVAQAAPEGAIDGAASPAAPAAATPGTDAGLVLGTLATGPNAALEEWVMTQRAAAA